MTTFRSDEQQPSLPFNSGEVLRMFGAVAAAFKSANSAKGGLPYKVPSFLEALHKLGYTVAGRPDFVVPRNHLFPTDRQVSEDDQDDDQSMSMLAASDGEAC